MTPPFSAVSKSCDPPSVSNPPFPLLISDKSLSIKNFKKCPAVFLLSIVISYLRFSIVRHPVLFPKPSLVKAATWIQPENMPVMFVIQVAEKIEVFASGRNTT